MNRINELCTTIVLCLVIAIAIPTAPNRVNASRFEIVTPRNVLSKDVKDYLNAITPAEWQQFVRSGVESVDRQKRLEANLINSRITVENGSVSHIQLLDTLPNEEATRDSDIALKILKASLSVYNQKCAQHGISGEDCKTYLSNKPIPENTELARNCSKIIQSRRDGHHAFRRLLPRYYQDGFYSMYSEDHLPSPRLISKEALNDNVPQATNTDSYEDKSRNLALVQWTQFVEHDLSKPVVTSMSNGSPIECCNRNSHKLQPRYNHPACAPLLLKDEDNVNGHQSCLNYVRSALAVGYKSTFGAAEQLNQVTGSLDLSQLYGFTEAAQQKMRTFKNGEIKSTRGRLPKHDLLPKATENEGTHFCALKDGVHVSSCFMAGDSRVNNSPFTVLIYTIFLRNHNRVAVELSAKYPNWGDDQIFQSAKAINVDIYRRIIVNEWLPAVLGQQTAMEIVKAPKLNIKDETDYDISNEFAVAAMRFYYSMLPNVLHNSAASTDAIILNNMIGLSDSDIFVLNEQTYNPQLGYTDSKLDEILESLLNQNAMKMDASYVSGLIWRGSTFSKPTHVDVLAFDIQRGRDHGVQPYAKYLEACHNVKINGWTDFAKFMSPDHINKLQRVYKSWSDVDLIIGGISEKPLNDSTVGPTFSCILSEQFVRIHQNHQIKSSAANQHILNDYKNIGGADLLCLNSNLDTITNNIFQLSSDGNPLINCANRLKTHKQ